MEDRLLDKIAEPFNLQLPEFESMEAMLDGVLPSLKGSTTSYLDADDPDNPLFAGNWVRMTDTPGATQVVLYTFSPMGNIRIATDGEISNSSFEIESRTRIIMGESPHRGSMLYNLVLLNNDYFILMRHGNTENFKNKYVVFCTEAIGSRLKWDEALERLVAQHRDSNFPIGIIVAFLLVTLALLYFFF